MPFPTHVPVSSGFMNDFTKRGISFWIFFSLVVTFALLLLVLVLVLSKRDAKEREEKRRQRTRRVFLMLGILFSSSSLRECLRGCGPYKIARWPPFFFLLLLLGWTEIRRTVPRNAGGSRGQLELSVDERVAHGARRCAFSPFVSLFIRKVVCRRGRSFPREAKRRFECYCSHRILRFLVFVAFLFSLLVLATLVVVISIISLTRACFLYYE